MNERKGKNIVIALLCVAIVGMGIGFAALATTINIGGKATITSTWNVQLTDAQVLSHTGKGSGEIAGKTATSVTLNSTLVEPGDSVTFQCTVKNAGTINAVLETLTNSTAGAPETDAIKYDVVGISEKDPLNASQSHVFTVVATYKADAKGEKAPTPEEMTKDITLTLDYAQAK